MGERSPAEHAAVVREAHRESLLYQESGSRRFYEADAAFNRWLDALVVLAERAEAEAEYHQRLAGQASTDAREQFKRAERAEAALLRLRDAVELHGIDDSSHCQEWASAALARREARDE